MFESRREPFAAYIQRHEDRHDEFYCSHPEAEGRYVIAKPSFGLDLKLERVKSAILSTTTPTQEASQMAEWAAVWEVGLSEKPKGVILDDIVDNGVVVAVYGEVLSYWRCFREQRQASTL